MGDRCCLAELLIFNRQLSIVEIGDGPETAHAGMLGVVGEVLSDISNINTSISSSGFCVENR